MATMQIYDGLENPPKFLEQRSAPDVGELIRQADAMSVRARVSPQYIHRLQ